MSVKFIFVLAALSWGVVLVTLAPAGLCAKTAPGLCVKTTTSAASGLCAKTVPAWHIKQSSYNLGTVDITVAKDGLRWHNDKVGLTLLMHAPDWKLNAYNETNKKYLTLNRAEALEVFQHQRRRDKAGMEAPIRVDKGLVIAGMPAVCYCYAHDSGGFSDTFAVKVTSDLENGKKLTAEQKKYIDNALTHERREYYLSKGISVSPRISAVFLEKIAATAYGDSLPLRMIQVGSGGTRTTVLDTTEIKRVSISPDTFKGPQGYKKAENKIALLVNDSEFDDFESDSSSSPISKLNIGKHEDAHR
ncbi:MAG TPA: hypothetical protein V6C89_10920 [Drouetiella sp.]|jgi:hypothetical protein